MRVLAAFVAGVVLAAGAVYFIVTKDQAAETPVVFEAQPEQFALPAEATGVETASAEKPVSLPALAIEKPVSPLAPAAEEPVHRTAERLEPAPAEAPDKPSTAPPPAVGLPPPPKVEPAGAKPAPARGVLAELAEEPPPPPEPNRVTLLAGALLTIRLAEDLSTKKNVSGDAFLATLDQPLIVDGFVVAERGSRVEGRVVTAQKAGRVKGAAVLGLQLVRFDTADGQKIAVSTDTFEKEGASEKAKDAAKIGAAAAIGAAIGAIAGGGKGAAVGAAVGSGAGTGGVLATRGKPAGLPVETRITFRLNAPVTITEKR